MSAQREAEMLLALLCRSNVQLVLRLSPVLHTVISIQASGYSPLQWADCQLPWITISERVLWAIWRRAVVHIEYSSCFTGHNRLANSQTMKHQTSSWKKNLHVGLHQHTQTDSVHPASYVQDIVASVYLCIIPS